MYSILDDLINSLVPIAICVVLPIWIVWLVMRTAQLRDRQRADIILKAIETNNTIDANQLTEALSKPRKAPRTRAQQLNLRLTIGTIFTFIGVVISILTFILAEGQPVFMFFMLSLCAIVLAIGIGFLISFFSLRNYYKNEK